MEFKGTQGKWKHKKGKRSLGKYDNLIYDEKGNIIIKWSNTGNGSYKLTIKESHANGKLVAHAPEMLDFINRISGELLRNDFALSEKWYEQAQQLIKSATEV